MSGDQTNQKPDLKAREAIFEAIAAQAKALSPSKGQGTAAEALKNLAEAYAWAQYPNQPH